MRRQLKFILLLLGLSCGGMALLGTWLRCPPPLAPPPPTPTTSSGPYEPLECTINGERAVACLRKDKEVFLPFFSFLQGHLEVFGKLSVGGGGPRFDWQHSYSRVYHPKSRYDPRGKYLWLESYNVEVRDRVKCISGALGIPVSVQWDPQGHLYPVQIAQYGLSHFSKHLAEPDPSHVALVAPLARWAAVGGMALHDGPHAGVLHFSPTSQGEDPHGVLRISRRVSETTLLLDFLFESNGTQVTVVLADGAGAEFRLEYVSGGDALGLGVRGTTVTYPLGPPSARWRHLARDLPVDLAKGLRDRKLAHLRHLGVKRLEVRGSGALANLTLASSAHLDHFWASAEWLLRAQHEDGGWPILAARKLSGGMLELPRGWYSAMAQGQAISVLTRAYHLSGGRQAYLDAAVRGLGPFTLSSSQHGVRATFFDRYVWYEEYPTTPSSFVLNGFVFSLFGLHDLASLGECGEGCVQAHELLEQGLTSLRAMLPLFDTGAGTVYDLRHVTLGAPPNRARWDYHSTHINQLLWLATLADPPEPLWTVTAARWAGYMRGKRSPHN